MRGSDVLHLTIKKKVLSTIRKAGLKGIISDEVLLALPGYPYNLITAQYNELVSQEKIYRQGKRPGHSGVSQSIMFAINPWEDDG